jgi:hypothetical protein
MYQRAFYLIISILLLFVNHDNFNLTYLSKSQSIAWSQKFSLLEWELVNLPQKWTFMIWNTISNADSKDMNTVEKIELYIDLSKRVNKYERLLDTSGNNYFTSKNVNEIQDHTKLLKSKRDSARLIAEKSIEDEITKTLKELGFRNKLGLVFPPVDIRLQNIPKVLVTSPRNEIRMIDSVLIDAEISLKERDTIETTLFQAYDTSALVDDLSGVATYPLLVDDQQSLRRILQTSVHEWFHAYFFFKPLGWNYWDSREMTTLNETICTLLGEEIGDVIYFNLYETDEHGLIDSKLNHPNEQLLDKMRSTRIEVDKLLSEGEIDSAEQLMKETWWELRLGGYRIRKLNQAYFAFRGRYGNSPASISNIGDQVNMLRENSAKIKSFVNTVSEISDYNEFLDIID